jgi:excisionase family DNA binding protein
MSTKDPTGAAARKLVTDVTSGCQMLDVSRDRFYRILRSGEIESYLDGRSRKILVASLEAYVEKRRAASKKFTRSRYLNHPAESAA